MPPFRILVAAVAGLALVAPITASAQDWLGRMARGAVQGAAERAVRGVVTSATSGNADQPATTSAPTSGAQTAPTPRPGPAAGALPADLPAPRPINYSPSLQGPTVLEFSEADKAARKAFEDASRVSCSACEGGRTYENWVRHARSELFGMYVLDNRLGGMAVGESIRWRGSTTGTEFAIVIADARPIGQWECKQLRWTARRAQASERPGLVCKLWDGNWKEVF